MDLKDYLESIGIEVADNVSAYRFLSKDEIKGFISEKWAEIEIPPIPMISEESKSLEKEETELITDIPDISLDETEDAGIDINDEDIEPMGKFSSDPNELMGEDAKERARDEAFEMLVKSKPFSLQNGKANQPYHYSIDPQLIDACEIGEYWFEGLEELGLEFDKEHQAIKGTPEKAGDHRIEWYYKRKGWPEEKAALSRLVTLVINPDPRSLWNNIPTETDIPFYKPDCDKQFISIAADKNFFGMEKERRKDMVAASQRGRSHAHEGKPRDDDFKLFYDKDTEWYTIAVADGAGSAQYSRRGSEIACNAVVEVCNKLLADSGKAFGALIKDYHSDSSDENRKKIGDAIYKILGSAVFKAYKDIETEAQNSNNQIKDFSTTLLISICRKFKFGWFVASFWVGDGGIGIYNRDTRYLKIMGESDGGEFAGQTRFLTMSEVMQPGEIYRRLRFEIVDDFTALVLMTDGITDPKFETDANLLRIEKWDDLWNDLSMVVTFDENNQEIDSQLLKWLDYWVPGNHDDRTIAILF
ncbi:MAG: PP2C family serine/threonine-protein phosphatase [Dysgonomonas sp.]|nr:PP2C family serine/threonine-protein phosphatase [Dysgonomonas sp.]